MSEQELIREAKGGSGTAMLELWDKWRRLIYLKCSRYYKSGSHYDMEDIMQTAFIGFCKGVELYDEGKKCGLITYAMYHIRKAIRRDVLGIDLKVNPLDEAVSLYKPLPCDEDLTLLETIANGSAVDIEQYIIWQDAGQIMRKAVKQLNDKQRELIRLRFYEKLEYKDIAEITGLTVSRAREKVLKAQRRLWCMKEIRHLKAELFPPKDYRAPTDYTAVYNVESDRDFWSGVARWA